MISNNWLNDWCNAVGILSTRVAARGITFSRGEISVSRAARYRPGALVKILMKMEKMLQT